MYGQFTVIPIWLVLLLFSYNQLHGLNIGDECIDESNCTSEFSTCNGSVCVCQQYHAETDVINGTVRSCDEDLQLGSPCNATSNCSGGATAECSVNNVCQCAIGFYDDNNAEIGGQCRNISELMVKDVVIFSVAETQLFVNWTNPPADILPMVEKILIIAESSIEQKQFLATNQNETLLTDLTPGYTYNVTVITEDTNSRASTQRVYAATVAKTTHPAQPGTLVNSTRYIAPTVRIEWLPSGVGKVDQYVVLVTDNAGYGITDLVKSPFVEMTGLSPDTTYIVTITAISGIAFDPQESLPRIHNITTAHPSPTAPRSLSSSNVTRDSFLLTFEDPAEIYGILEGYVIVVKKRDNCVKQIIFTCQNCSLSMSVDDCNNSTYGSHTVLVNITDTYFSLSIEGLQHYTNYTVQVFSVDDLGPGTTASINALTNEIAPDIPYNLRATQISATWIELEWDINGTEPGDTEYVISVLETLLNGSESIEYITVQGFYERKVNVTGLEEFWPYRFQIEVKTSINSSFSEITPTINTDASGPGPVVDFTIVSANDSFRYVIISWQIPPIIDRNGILQDYVFTTNSTGSSTRDTIPVEENATIMKKNVTIIPDILYLFEIYITNTDNMTGQVTTLSYNAPSGAPPKPADIMDIIPTEAALLNSTQTSFQVEINVRVFDNSINGDIYLFGLAVCKTTKCNQGESVLSPSTTYQDWEYMRSWSEARSLGFPLYRPTGLLYMSQVMDILSNDGPNSSAILLSLYTVGENTVCSSVVASSTYCNGPVDPGSQYRVVVFACTRGGCMNSGFSEPFSTLPAPPESASLTDGEILAICIGASTIVVFITVGIIAYHRREYYAAKRRRPFPTRNPYRHRKETSM